MTLFYVDKIGLTAESLLLHSGHYGDDYIQITATGTTIGMVDWQMVGIMECFGHSAPASDRAIGLVWDETRLLIDFDGVPQLTRHHKAALVDAGFNLYNFGE